MSKREELYRVLSASKESTLNTVTMRVITCLIDTENYLQALSDFVEESQMSVSDDDWSATADLHRLVVVWRPGTAHEWLYGITDHPALLRATRGLCYSTALGLLEAGVWLDKGWYCTKFQEELLIEVMKFLCRGTARESVLPRHCRTNVDWGQLQKRLPQALASFASPEKTTHRLYHDEHAPAEISEEEMKTLRRTHIARAIEYVHHNKPEQFHEVASFVIERLTHTLLARMTPEKKIAAIHHAL